MLSSFRLISCLALLMLTGCNTIPTKYIETQIDINAPPEVVWKILVDTPNYSEWNPYHREVLGSPALGEHLTVMIHKPNGNRLTLQPQVTRHIENRLLAWGGGIPPCLPENMFSN